jgi:hypothetical protein
MAKISSPPALEPVMAPVLRPPRRIQLGLGNPSESLDLWTYGNAILLINLFEVVFTRKAKPRKNTLNVFFPEKQLEVARWTSQL